MATVFHRFPYLPKELRDEIWRLCLPRRVVELDYPERGCHSDENCPTWLPTKDSLTDDGEDDEDHTPWSCCLWPTTRFNSAMPVISRVCHEARSVALSAGHVYFQETPWHPASFDMNTDGFWLDPTRDILHLHWHTFMAEAYDPLQTRGDYFLNPLKHLVAVTESHPNITGSICADLLDENNGTVRQRIMRLLEQQTRWLICTDFVNIHVTDEAAAVRSGLWGLLGDERVVLVDACDSVRFRQYENFWQEYGVRKSTSTAAFFEACVHGVPKLHYFETPEEFLLDLETRWLLHPFVAPQGDSSSALELLNEEVWLTQPRDFDGREDDPRRLTYGGLPGRPFARQLWSPKRDHPWVQDVLSRMPDFRPTVMFRLCTSDCVGAKLDSRRPHRVFPSPT